MPFCFCPSSANCHARIPVAITGTVEIADQQVIVGRGLGHRATSRNVDVVIAFGRCKGGGVTDVSVPSRGGIGRYVDVTIALGSGRGISIAGISIALGHGAGKSGVREEKVKARSATLREAKNATLREQRSGS
jgi:hypothetical protein